jgi:hypothetical protein
MDSPAAAAAQALMALAQATPAAAAAAAADAAPAAGQARGRKRVRLSGIAEPYSDCTSADLVAFCRQHAFRLDNGKQVRPGGRLSSGGSTCSSRQRCG